MCHLDDDDCEHTDGAEEAAKIKAPRYAAPLYERVPVALINAPTPYAWTAEPTREVPQAAPADAASFDLKNSSLLLAA
jgi:hypothetical protein